MRPYSKWVGMRYQQLSKCGFHNQIGLFVSLASTFDKYYLIF